MSTSVFQTAMNFALEEAKRYRASIEALSTEQIEGQIRFLDCDRLREFYTSHLAELRWELARRNSR